MLGFAIGVLIAISKKKIKLAPLSVAAFLSFIGSYLYQLLKKYGKPRR